jgi:hypothetical protein
VTAAWAAFGFLSATIAIVAALSAHDYHREQ